MRKFCVYTAITGGYEVLGDKLPANEKDIPFICLTDNPDLVSDYWDVRYVPSLFPLDSMRNQRVLKIKPHQYLPDFDSSLYLDNSVLLKTDPNLLYNEFFKGKSTAFFMHSYRSSVYEEFIAVMDAGLDRVDRIAEQLSHYEKSIHCGALFEKPYWGGIIYRDHRDAGVQYFSDVWMAHVLRYARRDQLSLNYALRLSGISPYVINFDICESDFHQWPRLGISRVKKEKRSIVRKLIDRSYAFHYEMKLKKISRIENL